MSEIFPLPDGYNPLLVVGPDDTNYDDDSSSSDDYDSEDCDVRVYTYGANPNQPRNRGTYAFSCDFIGPGTWGGAAEDLHAYFSDRYDLPINYAIMENPRLCCAGYYARYFLYRDPQSNSDYGEPKEEFFPEHHEWLSVMDRLNRINLYKISSTGV